MALTKVSDLSIEDFKIIIREVVEQTLAELLMDPDEGLVLREDAKSHIQELLTSYGAGATSTKSAQKVAENLGLEW